MSDATVGAVGPETVDVAAKLRELARSTSGPRPVISVYLDTRWADEHQRERVRTFLKNEVRKAAAMSAGQLDAELAWIDAEGERLASQESHPGTAMFAGGPGARREVLHFAVPFADSFAIADTPRLRPLVDALGDAPRAAVLFVDSQRARMIAITEQGAGEHVELETGDALGQHRRGGWSLLLQSRYQRHIHVHRARHFDAVALALAELVDHCGLRAIVLAGEPRNVAVFRTHLPPRLEARLAGEVSGTRYEPPSALAERALSLIRHRAAGEAATALDAVLVEAEGGGRAVAGVDATMNAVNRDTVERLYVLRSFAEDGRVCATCRALHRAEDAVCTWCGGTSSGLELGEAMVRRVLAAGGDVGSMDDHAGLERAGGVAAFLRYPPR